MDPQLTRTATDAPMFDLEALRSLLSHMPAHVTPRQPKTFFSLGGRGHLENPASDVLRFFLHPAEEHGFGPLFLRVFFDCMGTDASQLNLEAGINSVDREEWLDDEGRIDLVVRAPGWVLAIENKIQHRADNNFDAYAKRVRQLAGPIQPYFALLAPNRIEVGHNWKPFTYRDLCARLTDAFDQLFPNLPGSTFKWQVFAREFVTHLQTHLYPTAMPPRYHPT